MSRVLIADRDLPIVLARRYMALGYQPVVVPMGKSWLSGNGLTEPINQHRAFLSEEEMIAKFEENPNSGIGILGNFFRDGSMGLTMIDVDVPDSLDSGASMQVVANIIGTPCPVKHGQKGGTFFVRYPSAQRLTDILKERDIFGASFAKATKILFPHLPFENANRKPGIDIQGAGGAHSFTVVPPSRHKDPNPDGSDRFYKWVPFPGTDIVQDLSTVPPADLPEIQPYYILLIYQYAKNPTSPIFQYIGQTAHGDHHALMRDASYFMYHEKFTLDEITEICEAEAERTAPDSHILRERLQEIKAAVKKLPSLVPDPKPAKTGSKSDTGNKIPLDRLMTDWLLNKYHMEDLCYFSAILYHWIDNTWTPLNDLRADDPWHKLSKRLYAQFDIAGSAPISSAIKLFRAIIPTREPAPDPNLIAFQNGILDTRDWSIRPEVRDDYIVSRIPYDFNYNATSPVWQQFLKALIKPPAEYDSTDTYDEDWKKAYCLVEEFLGYCLVRSHEFEKMLFLIGKPGTGKSTLFKALGSILPKGFVSNVAMEQFVDPNSMIDMTTANLNVASEADNRNKNTDRLLLNICSGEHIKLKVLYEDARMVTLPTRLLFHGNNTPDTYDSTGAIERRSLIVRTTDDRVADTGQQRLNYHVELIREAEGILAHLAKAYRRLRDRGHFEIPSYSKAEAHNMTVDANSVSRWVDEMCIIVDDHGISNQELYSHYAEWAEANGFRPVFNVITWAKKLTSMGIPSYLRKLPGVKMVKYRRLKLVNNQQGASY